MVDQQAGESVRETPSRWRLAARGYWNLIVALIVGSLLSAPVLLARAPSFNQTVFVFRSAPPDDNALAQWGESQAGVEQFAVERRDQELWIRWEYRGPFQRPTQRQIIDHMRATGYEFQGMRGMSGGLSGGLAQLIRDPPTLAALLAGTQVAFLVIGWYQVRRASRTEMPLPALFPPNYRRAVVIGVAGGAGLLALGYVYSRALQALVGQDLPSPWDNANLMSPAGKMVFLLFGAIGAPVAEEVFFRGYLLGMFRRGGDVAFGTFFSALLFALVHFSDSYNVPGTFLFGIVLAALYCRTGSLLAPIVAHAVNNGVAITGMLLEWSS